MASEKLYVLITGGTTGIGFELAKLFARDGYNLIIVARKQDELDKATTELIKRFNVEVLTFPKDLFDPFNAFRLYDEIKAKGIEVGTLVNNAGHGHYGKFAESSLTTELDIIHLNISSLVILTKLFLKDMLKRGEGKILNVSSVAGKFPGPYQSVYHGTKAFVQSFSEALHYEVKDQGITVTSLLPGATDTDFFRKADMESSKLVQDHELLADPADVAWEGYVGLMAGKDMVVPGFKNKMHVKISGILSDEFKAEKAAKLQEPVDGEE